MSDYVAIPPILNHDEAMVFACMKSGESNLARCYLERTQMWADALADRDRLAAELEAAQGLLHKTEDEKMELRAELSAARADAEAGRQLWDYMVENGIPWSDPDLQEALTAMGLLVAEDMNAEDSGPECDDCAGDCGTCYRPSPTLLARTAPSAGGPQS